MRSRRLAATGILLILATLACNVGSGGGGDFAFATPEPLFPSRTPRPGETITPGPNAPPTFAPTATFTATPRVWPSPYNGSPGPTQVTPIPPPASPLGNPDDTNILLIGSDRRTTSFRTDTMIILNIQPESNLVTMISIPRDLYVYVPGWKMERINAAYLHGDLGYYEGLGPALIKDTLLYNLGVQIDFIAMVDFAGFERIVDEIGGIDVPVNCSFTDWHIINPNRDPEDEDNWELFTLEPGLVHMDGDLALWYARSRLRSSDFDRGRRQQEVIRAIFAKALQLNMIPQAPDLYNEFSDSVITDIQLSHIVDLMPVALDMSSANIRSYYINQNYVTAWRSPTGASLQLPKPLSIQALLTEALSPPDPLEAQNLSVLIEIWNGTRKPDFGDLAAERLNYGGFVSIQGIADNTAHSQTVVYDFTPTQDTARSQALLDLLGLDSSRLISSPEPLNPYAYRIIIGADYDPCFRPDKITR